MRVLQTSKDELQSHCNQQASLVSELQSKNSGLTLEVENLRRRVEEMGQVSRLCCCCCCCSWGGGGTGLVKFFFWWICVVVTAVVSHGKGAGQSLTNLFSID